LICLIDPGIFLLWTGKNSNFYTSVLVVLNFLLNSPDCAQYNLNPPFPGYRSLFRRLAMAMLAFFTTSQLPVNALDDNPGVEYIVGVFNGMLIFERRMPP
jgi:hypothetical protein